MIEISNHTKAYGQTRVVDDVSVTLNKGGVISIIGPNGAGKSTLLSIVSRLMEADSGTVRIDGMDVTRTASDIMARRIAILRQDNHLASRLTVRDLVAFGRYPYSRGRPTAADKGYVDRALDYLALTPLADRFLDELSGGQRQRAFVAMVICQDTDYVLLDEPLNNLDMRHAVSMMKLMRRMADELGKTVILVLHDINFASVYSDTILAMRDGRVVRFGPPEQVVTPDSLAAIYDMDIAVHAIGGRNIGIYYG